MADQHDTRTITERELREGELQMTQSPPAGTGFIGFVADMPDGYKPLTSPLGETMPVAPPLAASNGSSADD